jgi:TonB family protein
MIESADVLQSSGSADLDQTALAAVRATSFPVPPEGSTDRQRSYTVPFDFK